MVGVLALKAVQSGGQVVFEEQRELGKLRLARIGSEHAFYDDRSCVIPRSAFEPGENIRAQVEYEPNGTGGGLRGWVALQARGL